MCKNRVRIEPLIARLEYQTGKRRRDTEYADEIGISRQTFKALLDGKGQGVLFETVDKLTCFFERHGMPVGPGDLFSEK